MASLPSVSSAALPRLGRGALFAFATAMTAGCSSVVPLYGAPAPDGGGEQTGGSGGGDGVGGGVMPLYGLPDPSGGAGGVGGEEPIGASAALYGLPDPSGGASATGGGSG